MNTDSDNYLIPIILGVLAEDGIDVNDQILEKLITPQLIKIKNTFPSSPFLVLTPMANEKERLMARLTVGRLEADIVAAVKDPHIDDSNNAQPDIKTINLINTAQKNEDQSMTPPIFTASQSQILIALKSGAEKSDPSEVERALELRNEGRFHELYSGHDADISTLGATELGLLITINPATFDINTRLTPVQDTEQDAHEFHKVNTTFAEKLSFAFNTYIKRVTGVFDKFYTAYIEIPDDEDKDRLARSPFVEIAEKIDGYNKDISHYIESRGTGTARISRGYLLSDEVDNPLISGDNTIERIIAPYSGADVLSQFYQKKTNTYINWIYILFFAAVLLYGIIDLNYYLVLLYIALIPAIAFLVYRSKAEKIEDRFLDYRALAEGLRVMVFWNLAGINEKVSDNYLSKYAGLLSWISRAIKNVEVVGLANGGTCCEGDAVNKKERIQITNKLWIESQLEYYRRKRNPLYMRSLDLGNLALVSFVLTLLFVLMFGIYLLFVGLGNEGAINRFEVLIGAAAAVGVAAQAYKNKKAYDELERRYTLTQQIYRSASKMLKANSGSPDNILIAVGKEALLENSDWIWTHRNLPIELPKG
jgi:hypothetical protein